MSTTIGFNYPVLAPLLPVTGTFAVPFTAYFSYLSLGVVRCRLNDEYYLGDNSSKSDTAEIDKSNKLYIATRCHKNFTENVPFALVLAAIAELNGANRKVLTSALSILLVFRILHVELGIKGPEGMGHGRPIGYFGTIATVLGLAGYTGYLVKDYWLV